MSIQEGENKKYIEEGKNPQNIKLSHHKRYREDLTESGDVTKQIQDDNTNDNTIVPNNVPRSIEGYILIIDGIHEEAVEDDVLSIFEEYGQVKQLHINLDRKTGQTKGYALLEYENPTSAVNAILDRNNTKLLDQTITVDWAFRK